MQFGSANPPLDFQWYINYTIKEALDDIESAYLDDILIDNNFEEEHVKHIRWIVQHLLAAGLDLTLEKFVFHKETIWYLRLISSTKEISTN